MVPVYVCSKNSYSFFFLGNSTSLSRIVIPPSSVDGTSVCLFLEFQFLFFLGNSTSVSRIVNLPLSVDGTSVCLFLEPVFQELWFYLCQLMIPVYVCS